MVVLQDISEIVLTKYNGYMKYSGVETLDDRKYILILFCL